MRKIYMFSLKSWKQLGILGFALISTMSWGHHSAAGYDIESRVAISGKLTKASFRNPHGTLKLKIDDKVLNITTVAEGVVYAGKVGEKWEIETAAANLLRRRGWNFKGVKKGQHVILVGHPAKDGSPLIYLREIHMQDGTVYGDPKGKDKALD